MSKKDLVVVKREQYFETLINVIHVPLNALNETFDKHNFFIETQATFKEVGHKDIVIDYESNSGSKYSYTKEGVYRLSNHWGNGVASCDWHLDTGDYGMGNRHTYISGGRYDYTWGFCKWVDFEINKRAYWYLDIVEGKNISVQSFKNHAFPHVKTDLISDAVVKEMRKILPINNISSLSNEHKDFVKNNSKSTEYYKKSKNKTYYRDMMGSQTYMVSRFKKLWDDMKVGDSYEDEYEKVKVSSANKDEITLKVQKFKLSEFEHGGEVGVNNENNHVNITLEDLQKVFGGRIWEKGNLKRLYLDRGYNTKKVRTTVYIYKADNGLFFTNVYIDAPSQHWNWIESQKEELEYSIDSKIRDVISKTTYAIINEDNLFINSLNQLTDDISNAELFRSLTHANNYIHEELEGDYKAKKVDNPNYVFYKKEKQSSKPKTSKKEYVIESKGFDYVNNSIKKQKDEIKKLAEKMKKTKENINNKEGNQKGTGRLYEFFTPQVISDKMLALAYHYGFNGGAILDPAIGSGRLIDKVDFNTCTVDGFEINKDNVAEVNRLYPKVKVNNYSFERIFLKEPRYNSLISRNADKFWYNDGKQFDLVIANPPYGKYDGFYSSFFSFKGQFEHFFIEQSMKTVRSGGLGVFLIPSSFLKNGITYNKFKEKLFKSCIFVDAYRLPMNVFKDTQIGTDIIVLKKK